MKKQFLIGIMLAFSSLAVAQEVQPYQYKTNFKHNLSFQPIALAIGIFNAQYSLKVAEHWTIGASVAAGTVDILDIEVDVSSFSVGGRYYFEPAFETSSWYLMGAVGYASAEAEIEDLGVVYSGEASGAFGAAGAGYNWFWNPWNLYLGALVSAGDANKIELKDSLGNEYDDEPNSVAAFGVELGFGLSF